MNKRVLVVDDQKQLTDFYVTALEMSGYDVSSAQDAAEAVSLLEMEPFDLITTDLDMPGMKGDELLNRLKESYPEMKRVVISGSVHLGVDLDDLVQRGEAHAVLNKPCKLHELLNTVEELA